MFERGSLRQQMSDSAKELNVGAAAQVLVDAPTRKRTNEFLDSTNKTTENLSSLVEFPAPTKRRKNMTIRDTPLSKMDVSTLTPPKVEVTDCVVIKDEDERAVSEADDNAENGVTIDNAVDVTDQAYPELTATHLPSGCFGSAFGTANNVTIDTAVDLMDDFAAYPVGLVARQDLASTNSSSGFFDALPAPHYEEKKLEAILR